MIGFGMEVLAYLYILMLSEMLLPTGNLSVPGYLDDKIFVTFLRAAFFWAALFFVRYVR